MRILILVFLAILGGTTDLVAGDSVLEQLDKEIRDLAKKSAPAIVKISVEREIPIPAGAGEGQEFISRGSQIGTGFLVSDRGLVLTTHKLVEGAQTATIRFPDGVIRQGEILGSDPFFKVAVVRIEPVEGVEPLELLGEENMGFGSLAIFVGYSYGNSRGISFGLVTGTRVHGFPFDRFDNFTTVNARQGPGGTGGPFLDKDGRVIGMAVASNPGLVSLVRAGTKQGGVIHGFPGMSGPAYSIPSADLSFVLAEIEAHGRVRSGLIGVNVLRRSLIVKDVHSKTPAEKAGLRPGDRLTALNDAAIRNVNEFSWILRRTPVGRPFDLTFVRGEKEKTVRLSLEEIVPTALSPLPGISITITAAGVSVRSVDNGHARFEVRVGDRILAVDGEAFESGDELFRVLKATGGRSATLDVVREGVRVTLKAKMEKKKPE